MSTGRWPGAAPAVGALVVDTRDGRVGTVTLRTGAGVRIRPLTLGAPWDAPVERVRPPTPAERLRALLAARNARQTWGR